jgi:hypothetical protein
MYIWEFSIEKATEGGIGTATIKSVLKGRKAEGIRINTYSSCYVGQTLVRIEMKDAVARTKVLTELKNYGYIDTIKEGLRDCKRIY